MFSKLSLITLEELRFMAPRVFLYAGVAYAATRVVRFGICQTGKLFGLNSDKE